MPEQKQDREKLKVLVFTAHPDDHFPCSGTMIKLRKKGMELYECLFTDGETSGLFKDGKFQENVDKEELKEVRSSEFKQATKILGTKEVFLLHQPNNGIERKYDLVLEVIKIIRKVKPFVVLMHGSNDYHSDHRALYEVVSEALRAASIPKALELGERYRVPVALCFDGLYMTNAQVIVDVSDVAEEKAQIVDCYKSQIPKNSIGYKVDDAICTYRAYQRGYINYQSKSGSMSEGFSIPEKYPVAGDELIRFLKDA
ncbi:hypothetical protein A2415_03685 [candidate division WWE3 bacterium RIFOXYC1_FULL_39_7]|uniref:GlcNAc-PI de-N-acetylase n=2 Tax=Katanobacteria TaxID=422282 RepID=A0A1F4X7T7_UNCKA|nr:MAG: hypothetical protein A2415_03685 [candidate division WWE3 bacterium RIFOXYC1_FULL_39_7]OGC77708.1 MAG: hypothetical protein A2619_03310 [candidate division WWE3 bacterium RIFOXYD1_FULL_39_9]